MPLVTCTRYSLAFSWLLFNIFMSFSLWCAWVCVCMQAAPASRIRIPAEEQRTSLKEHSRRGYLNGFFFLLSAVTMARILICGIRMEEMLYRALAELVDCREQRASSLRGPWTRVFNKHLFQARDTWSRDKWGPHGRNEERGKLGNYSHLCDAEECSVSERLEGNYERSRRDCQVEYIFSLRNVVNIFRAIQTTRLL